MGKIGPTEARGVEGMYQNSRCASREKTWVQSTKKLNENWDAIFLVFLSAVLRENFSSFRSTLPQFKPYFVFWTYGIDHSYEARVKCKIRYDGGLITWISAKPTDWTPEGNYHISLKMAENSVLCGELRVPRCPGFYRLVLHALLHLRLRHRYRRTMKMLLCVQQQHEVRIEWTSTRRPVTKPSQRTTNKHGENRYSWIAMRKGVTGKEITLTSRETEIAKCRRAELFGLYARDAQVKPYLEQQSSPWNCW